MSSGVLAAFASEVEWSRARDRLSDSGLETIESYTPAPPADLPETSPLPAWVAAAGLAGAVAGFGIQYYAVAIGYPLDIGGRPDFSWPSFVPIAFEVGALCAVLTGFFGYFIANRLPRLYDPVDACAGMRHVLRSEWVLAVRGVGAARVQQARALLSECHPLLLEDIEE